MSAYDSDPRVRQVAADQFQVYVGDVRYGVLPGVGRWFVEPPHYVDMYERARFDSPFASADAAIASLIGDPR